MAAKPPGILNTLVTGMDNVRQSFGRQPLPPQSSSISRGSALSRPVGNAQSRQPALGRAPQPGLTSNVNGAQTAATNANRGNFGWDPQAAVPQIQQFAPSNMVPAQQKQWMASQNEAGFTQQRTADQAQSALQSPAPAIYPGGDVPGLAMAYRNAALQRHQDQNAFRAASGVAAPVVTPDAPVGSLAASGSANAAANSGASGGVLKDQYGYANQYDGYTAAVNDPNRMTPTQYGVTARQGAQQFGQYDQTGMRGRFGQGGVQGQAAQGVLSQRAADQAAIAQGTEANRARLQGIAGDSNQRAMDPKSEGSAFSYQDANGNMVSTNRLGQLQELQRRNPDSVEVQSAIVEEQQRQSALGAKSEKNREEFRNLPGNNGLGDKAQRKLYNKRLQQNRAVQRGIITEGEANSRFNRDLEIAQGRADYRGEKSAERRSALDAGYKAKLGEIAGRDEFRLPSGELRHGAVTAAKADLAGLFSTEPSGNQRNDLEAQIVQSTGLTPEMGSDEAVAQIFKAQDPENPASAGITTIEQALAIQKYWRSKTRSDSKWAGKVSGLWTRATGLPAATQEQIDTMNEMAKVPPDQLQHWMEQNQHRLVPKAPEAPLDQYAPDSPHSGIPQGQGALDHRGRFPTRGY